jgi:hypothetical protein
MKRIVITAAAALVATAAGDLAAQTVGAGAPTGVQIGVYGVAAPGVSIKGEDIDGEVETKFGAGAGLQLGYAFTPRWMVFLGADINKQDSGIEGLDGDFGLVHLELGGRYTLAAAGKTLPYVLASVGSRAIGAEVEMDGEKVDMSLSGVAFNVGAGVEHFFSPKMALGADARLGFGKFGKYKVEGNGADIDEDIEVDNSMVTRIRVGLSFYPGR